MNGKEVKKINAKSFYLYIYNNIKEHKKLPSTELSKQRLNYYVKQLVSSGIITKIGYSVWEVTGNIEDFEKYKEVKKVKDVCMRTRGHGFVFQVLLKQLQGWSEREEYLKENFIPYEKIKQGVSITLRSHKIWLCNKSLVIYFSPNMSFFARDSYKSSANALMECKETIRAIERLLKINLKYGAGWFIRESRSHYADINNCLADYYHKRGINKFEITQNGKVWALIDNSFNLLELETIAGSGQSKEDLPKLQMFLNDLRDNPTTFTSTKEEIFELIKGLAKRTDEIQQQLHAQVELNNRLTEIILNKFNSE